MPNLTNTTLASSNDTFKLCMLVFTSSMVWLKLDLWHFQKCSVKYMCGVCRKIAFSSWFNPCYSGIWRWHICTIHVIVHLKTGLNKVRLFTQYFCFVLDVQGKSEQKLLVEDKLSNLTLASADDKICYWTFWLLNLRLFMTAQLCLKFWTFRFFRLCYTCIDAFFQFIKNKYFEKSNNIVIKSLKVKKKSKSLWP